MSHFDTQMMAITALLLLMGGITYTFLKEMRAAMAGMFLLVIMVWGDDICSRNDRMSFYTDHFDRGGEVICKDDNAHPLLISQSNGWERKGGYLFKGNQGVDILDDQCEILNKNEPHCIPITTQVVIGTAILIGIFGWMGWKFRQLRASRIKIKSREERKEKIRKGAEEMAELYNNDPELKEWNEFVGDYYETSEEYMKEARHEQKNV